MVILGEINKDTVEEFISNANVVNLTAEDLLERYKRSVLDKFIHLAYYPGNYIPDDSLFENFIDEVFDYIINTPMPCNKCKANNHKCTSLDYDI